MVNLLVIPAVFIAIIVPFVIVPEIAERTGRNPRSARVRLAVWVTFLLILFVPAIALAPGLLGGASWADWLVFGARWQLRFCMTITASILTAIRWSGETVEASPSRVTRWGSSRRGPPPRGGFSRARGSGIRACGRTCA